MLTPVIAHSDEPPAMRRLNELRRAQPGDPTLRNLLGVLTQKLDLCARLPVFEYEATSDGDERCALAFRRLADAERRSTSEVIECLREHLTRTATEGS